MQITGFRTISNPKVTFGTATPVSRHDPDDERMLKVLRQRYPKYWQDTRQHYLYERALAYSSQKSYWQCDIEANRVLLGRAEVREALNAIPLDVRQIIASAAKALKRQRSYHVKAVVGQRSIDNNGNASTVLNPANIIAVKAGELPTNDIEVLNTNRKMVAGCIDIVDFQQSWYVNGGVRDSHLKRLGIRSDGLHRLICISVRQVDSQAEPGQRDVITNVIGICLPEEGFVPIAARILNFKAEKPQLNEVSSEESLVSPKMVIKRTDLTLSSREVNEALCTMVQLLPNAHYVQWDDDTHQSIGSPLTSDKKPVVF